MTVQIKTINLEPKRQTFGHIAHRLGGGKPASRYQEATLDVQATDQLSLQASVGARVLAARRGPHESR